MPSDIRLRPSSGSFTRPSASSTCCSFTFAMSVSLANHPTIQPTIQLPHHYNTALAGFECTRSRAEIHHSDSSFILPAVVALLLPSLRQPPSPSLPPVASSRLPLQPFPRSPS